MQIGSLVPHLATMQFECLQENIQLAKKDWELSHLQTMREEEEKMAEEEAADESLLTYDRPDLCNKVTLRRSSTGMWEVCSSDQSAENENGVLGCPKKNSERPAKNVELGDSENMEHDSNKRTLRSAHCKAQVDSITTSGNAKLQGGHRNDSSVNHQKTSRSSLKACAKDFSMVVALPSIPVMKHRQHSPDVLAGGDESRSPSAKPVRNSSKFHSNCSNTAEDGTSVDCSESLTNSISPVNHKYATRQKVALHNSK